MISSSKLVNTDYDYHVFRTPYSDDSMRAKAQAFIGTEQGQIHRKIWYTSISRFDWRISAKQRWIRAKSEWR